MLASQGRGASGTSGIGIRASLDGHGGEHWLRQRLSAPTLLTISAITLALAAGVTIANGKWFYLLAIVVLPLVLLRPVESALGAFALLVPFDSVAAIGGGQGTSTSLNWFIGGVAAAVLLFVGLAGDRLDKPRRTTVSWALFVGWSAITILWALDQKTALSSLPTAISLLIMYFVATSLRITKRELSGILVCTTLGGLVAALYAIYSHYQGISYHSILGMVTMRSSLVIGNRETDPNEFANSLLLPFSLAFGMFLSARRGIAKTAMLAVVAIILLSVFLTMSRGGLLSLIVIAVVYVYRLRLKLRVLIPIALGGVLLLAAPSLFFKRISEALETGGAGRVDIWRAGLEASKSYGVFGAGLGNFPVAFDRFVGYATHFEGYGRGSHNIYLNVLVELGIVGFVLLLNAFRTELRGRKFADFISPFHSAVACEAAAWGMLAGCMFLDILWKKAFWLVWIVLAAATLLQKSASETPEGVYR
jgi:O-antigen ligase